jgi:hypothetical protein
MNEWLPKFKGENLRAEIEKSTAGLTYISETDAAVEPYAGGKADVVEIEHITTATRHEEMLPRDFFSRLTADRDWYGAAQKEIAKRYASLEKLLEENLRDLKVFKVGRIQIDIYVVGLDADNDLIGIKTKAVET